MSKKPIKKLADLAKEALDMSKEARMARAEKMGFDTATTYYHGTNVPIGELDPAKAGTVWPQFEFGNASFFSDNPRIASDFAKKAANAVNSRDARAAANEFFSLEESLAKKIGAPPITTNIGTGKISFSEKLSPKDRDALERLNDQRLIAANRLYEGSTAYGQNVLPTHLKINNPLEVDAQGMDFNPRWAIEEAKAKGNDAVVFKNARDNAEGRTGTTVAVFDPSQIRSVNAKFDPAKKKSGNILDSLGPIAVGAAGVGVASQDAEAAPKAKNLELAARGAEIARQWSSHVWPTEEAAIERLRGWVAHQNRQFAKTFGETVLERDLLDATKISKTSEGYKLVPRLELPQTQPKPQYLTDKDLASAQVQSYVDSVGREFDKRFRGPTEVDVKKVRQGDSSPLDEQNVLQIMEQIKSGESVHPILIEKDGNGVLDGHHRLEAAKRLGIKKIPAVTYGAGALALSQSQDALAADLNSPVASGMGEVVSQAGHAMERFDAYTSNPFRKFLNSALEGKGIIQSAREGVQAFGAQKPTTGEEVAKNFLSLSPNQNLGFPTADGGKDYPLAGPLGVAVDFAVDPTNIPMAKAVGPSMDAASSISRIIEQSLLKRGLVLP